MTARQVYTIAEVAEILSCSKKHIYRMVAAGELPAIELGMRALRIPKEDFDHWFATRMEQARSVQQTRMF